MARLFGMVDGETNRRWDRAMYLTIPFDIRRISPPFITDNAQIRPGGSVAGEIVETQS